MDNEKVTILINQRPHHFEKAELTVEEFRAAVGAPADYEVWLVVRDPDPEGQLPVDDVQVTAPVQVKSGQRFRVVPPGTFGVLPAQLAKEVDELRQHGWKVDLVEADGLLHLLFPEYTVPPTMSKRLTRLLLKFPISYPNGRPDMFWTDEDLVLKDGRIPRNAGEIELVLGRRWRRFSWHPQAWNPARDDLRTYLEFVDRRLATAA